VAIGSGIGIGIGIKTGNIVTAGYFELRKEISSYFEFIN